MNCPCNPNLLYQDCCEKAHLNIESVSTCEALMRSRYSAFVLVNIDYLSKSHHSKTRPSKHDYKSLEKWTKSVVWVKLEVLKSTDTTVEFKAYFMENGKLDVINETSEFATENGHWVYVKGL
ncbi:Sec-C motif domain protein [Tamlana nanhaiensis]|uniref:Sec-C motif domain protein n=2 Tax=Neotamlana nanhaiensis TaxID=1382798 RepID=A0A0D7W5U9_9FLAO|nr:Sec-C motif domain protein [Tamlana nanhaiensis]